MFKIILPFYIICLILYIFFTRQPDYEDGEFTGGIIHYINQNPRVEYTVDKTTYTVNASYLLRHFKENESVTVIYDTSNPSAAAIYKWWGYWLRWDELIASIIIPFILYYVAASITKNPTPEALIEELEMTRKVKRRKYD